jgi:lipoprotein signal peptidase
LGESLQMNLPDSLHPGRVLFACPRVVDRFLFFGFEDVPVCFANGSSHYSVLIMMDAVIVTGRALMLILVFEGEAHPVKHTYI